MAGNVRELVYDWYETHPASSASDPAGPISGTHRASRGGNLSDFARSTRAAIRTTVAQAYENRTWGWPFKVLGFKKTAKRKRDKPAKPRLTTLERASKLQEMLDREPGLTRAELARRLGISRARVTQILTHLQLPPELTAQVTERAARRYRKSKSTTF